MLSKIELSSSKSCEFSAVVQADNISGGCGTLLALESIEILRSWWASSTEFIIVYYYCNRGEGDYDDGFEFMIFVSGIIVM